jgi:hypothetical protein
MEPFSVAGVCCLVGVILWIVWNERRENRQRRALEVWITRILHNAELGEFEQPVAPRVILWHAGLHPPPVVIPGNSAGAEGPVRSGVDDNVAWKDAQEASRSEEGAGDQVTNPAALVEMTMSSE